MNVREVLGPGGLLAQALPSYEPRASQLDMAAQVADALSTRRPLIVEAGTGTGKTLAYLVPAILSGMKVVISTGTKNLQEQIFKKDVPLLAAELPVSFSAACMKGISNYLCRRRFGEYAASEATLGSIDSLLDVLRAWEEKTDSGDRAELPQLSDDAPIWREVSATAETRLGVRCPHYEDCFVTRARRRAQAADLVIVNHHLFFADLALRTNWPQAQLLPAYEAVIFDEAHQLEDVVTDYFGTGVSTLRLLSLVRDIGRAVARNVAPEKLQATAEHVQKRSDAMFDALKARLRGVERTAIGGEHWKGEPEKASHALDDALEELEGALGASDGRALADGGEEIPALQRRAHAIRGDLALIVDGAQKWDSKHVFWAEQRGRSLFLHASPIDVSAIVREKVLGTVDAAIFTSATLATGGSFEFLRARLGLESAMEARLASPFDYRAQAILYLPKDLPEPGDDAFAEAAAERMRALVEITDGRAFLLFTSHRQMQRVHALLAPKLKQRVLLQGDMPKHLLVEEFKRDGGAVLFATASFWEGVDVIGDALSLVVIDKLPFAPPDDPLVAARARRLEEQGTDPFGAYHLPRAALQLAQGFGRLIRHRGDRGIVALLDRRAAVKSYGKRVLGSLPAECPRTDSLDAVRAFWGPAC
jgi:ATP-dependent DNA helicase DinG